ncbi:MAG: hypothetical protein IPK24_18490 [Kineosporiaceae bacterium]|nr:hypothetical protein [Kineosporiaceae bacterium]
MRVLVLTAGTALSSTRVTEVGESLRAAGGDDLEIDLFTWRAMESTQGLRSATILGPVTRYVPPPPKPEDAVRVAASRPAARASTTDAMAPPEDSSETGAEGRDTADTTDGTDATDTDESATSDATPLTLRRMAGTVRWGTKRKIIKARRSKPYQAVRRAVRGGIARQFATKARRDPAVLACAENAQLVLALDSGAISAAWWIARRVPAPPVVSGLAAAERELRAIRRPERQSLAH